MTFCIWHSCQAASVMFDYLRPYGVWPTRLLCPWDSPGKKMGVGCDALLQGTFTTQETEPVSPTSLAFAGGFFTTNTTLETLHMWKHHDLSSPLLVGFRLFFCNKSWYNESYTYIYI